MCNYSPHLSHRFSKLFIFDFTSQLYYITFISVYINLTMPISRMLIPFCQCSQMTMLVINIAMSTIDAFGDWFLVRKYACLILQFKYALMPTAFCGNDT